ncbi:hypothetical protein [Corynebacterium hindlerae]|uniref:hypothetical protein n=1 Tax=Corynebacterium hindlerae TaxID=699041 RepID=UPI003AAE2A4C
MAILEPNEAEELKRRLGFETKKAVSLSPQRLKGKTDRDTQPTAKKTQSRRGNKTKPRISHKPKLGDRIRASKSISAKPIKKTTINPIYDPWMIYAGETATAKLDPRRKILIEKIEERSNSLFRSSAREFWENSEALSENIINRIADGKIRDSDLALAISRQFREFETGLYLMEKLPPFQSEGSLSASQVRERLGLLPAMQGIVGWNFDPGERESESLSRATLAIGWFVDDSNRLFVFALTGPIVPAKHDRNLWIVKGAFDIQFCPFTVIAIDRFGITERSLLNPGKSHLLTTHGVNVLKQFLDACQKLTKAKDKSTSLSTRRVSLYSDLGQLYVDDENELFEHQLIEGVKVITLYENSAEALREGVAIRSRKGAKYRWRRRSHFRNQRVGEGRAETKVVRVKEHLVGSANLPLDDRPIIYRWRAERIG